MCCDPMYTPRYLVHQLVDMFNVYCIREALYVTQFPCSSTSACPEQPQTCKFVTVQAACSALCKEPCMTMQGTMHDIACLQSPLV